MKIGIDTFGCDHGKSGVGTYLKALINSLPQNSSHIFELFGSETDRYTYNSENANTAYTAINISDNPVKQRWWHFFYFNGFIKKQKYDVVLVPAGAKVLPFSKKIPCVLVVHDILKNVYSSSAHFIHKLLIKKSLRKASKIIAASQFIRKELVLMGIAQDKIEVIYSGIDHTAFFPRTVLPNEPLLIKPFSIKPPYIIFASRITYPEKRHIELIKAFTRFKKNTGLPHRLVLAGADGKHAEKVHQEALKSPYASDILLTGFFPQENFPQLYAASEACIFPSVTEGVGLPILEAMSSGIPVACSKFGALPEVAGNNALFFNPDDSTDFTAAITAVVTDNVLRQKLIQGGLEWTKRFAWEKTAQKTIETLEFYKNS